jgi:hypothetical protein
MRYLSPSLNRVSEYKPVRDKCFNRVCNSGYSGKSVRVELTQGLRKDLFDPVKSGILASNIIYFMYLSRRCSQSGYW